MFVNISIFNFKLIKRGYNDGGQNSSTSTRFRLETENSTVFDPIGTFRGG